MDVDVEDSWDHPLSGRQVGIWCVDLIEEVNTSPTELTEGAKALIGRLCSLGEPERVFPLLAQAAVLVSRELQFYIDLDEMLPIEASGEEKFKRSLLAAKTAFRSGGTETRSPSQPSDDG